MTNRIKRVEEYTLKKLAALEAHGFSLPVSKREKWSTTITSLSSDIAVAVELDWRELDVFVLVTALSGGKLPGGYYVSDGKKCRIHLENVLKDGCGVGDADIRNSVGQQPARAMRNEVTMQRRLDGYMHLLEQYISAIQDRGLQLFE